MKISSIKNTNSLFFHKNNHKTENKSPSFKSIYVEGLVNLGEVSEKSFPAVFLQKDALLLNAIAEQYPNQDCFIKRGYLDRPQIEYREKPPQVQIYNENWANEYIVAIDPNDKNYPMEPLILYKNSPLNTFFGMTSYISLNPSLPYTVKVGYELHKKLLEKKYQLMEVIGKTDFVDLGEDSLIKKAHKAIEDIETAVTRYLLEYAYAALTDRASASQIYASNYPKVQTRLEAMRKYDITTSIAKRPEIDPSELNKNKTDVCEAAMQNYPNFEENKERIKELTKYMQTNRIYP